MLDTLKEYQYLTFASLILVQLILLLLGLENVS